MVPFWLFFSGSFLFSDFCSSSSSFTRSFISSLSAVSLHTQFLRLVSYSSPRPPCLRPSITVHHHHRHHHHRRRLPNPFARPPARPPAPTTYVYVCTYLRLLYPPRRRTGHLPFVATTRARALYPLLTLLYLTPAAP